MVHVNILEYKDDETRTRGCDQEGTREGETLIRGMYNDRCHKGRVSTEITTRLGKVRDDNTTKGDRII